MSSFLAFLVLLSFVSGCEPMKPIATPTPSPVITTVTPISPTITPTVTMNPEILLPVRCLYVSFERRGYPSGYYTGDLINRFNEYDPVVGHTVAEEISYQLDVIKQMGVNTIAFDLRSSDPSYVPGAFIPPDCNIGPELGLQYPLPKSSEINNLVAFFDLLQSKNLKAIIRLVNTHMEEQSPQDNELWLGTILNAIKDHPALDLVLFEGNIHLVDSDGDGREDACGIPAEPPLWEGPTTTVATYIKFAIDYAHSLGLPYRKLSAEAIVGDYNFVNRVAAGPNATDRHLWDSVYVLKSIFDDLSIPDDERTYAISIYERPKCTDARISCTDAHPHTWAVETIENVFDIIGRDNGARIIAAEMGLMTFTMESSTEGYLYTPLTYTNWSKELALESLVWIMQNYGVDGGCFWQWANNAHAEELDPVYGLQVKQRGTEFEYNPVKDVLENLYTVGQTNYLNLMADAFPPVFSSVSIEPTKVMNGGAVELSIDLGEPFLFVSADFSELDTSKTTPITLIDKGNGIYKAITTINLWNESVNGIKQIPIQAMDFWGNISETSIEIELKNPDPKLDTAPPDDNFDGSVLDTSNWRTDLAGGAFVKQEERIIFSTDSQQSYSSARIVSQWTFTGDFDIQAEFDIGKGWNTPSVGHIDGAFFGVNINGQSYHITRLRSGSEDKVFVWNTTNVLIGEKYTDALTGKYRLIRTGTTLSLLFDIGAGWQKLASVEVPMKPAQVYLGNGSNDAYQTFVTTFDNFHINSGLTTY